MVQGVDFEPPKIDVVFLLVGHVATGSGGDNVGAFCVI